MMCSVPSFVLKRPAEALKLDSSPLAINFLSTESVARESDSR